MIGPHLAGDSIALEQDTRTDHVNCADNDRRHARIVEPLSIVDMRAAQGRDRKFASVFETKLPFQFGGSLNGLRAGAFVKLLEMLGVSFQSLRSFSASAVA